MGNVEDPEAGNAAGRAGASPESPHPGVAAIVARAAVCLCPRGCGQQVEEWYSASEVCYGCSCHHLPDNECQCEGRPDCCPPRGRAEPQNGCQTAPAKPATPLPSFVPAAVPFLAWSAVEAEKEDELRAGIDSLLQRLEGRENMVDGDESAGRAQNEDELRAGIDFLLQRLESPARCRWPTGGGPRPDSLATEAGSASTSKRRENARYYLQELGGANAPPTASGGNAH